MNDALDRIARSGEAVFAIDRRDRIVFWSRRCEELLGHSAGDVLGQPCYRITAGRDVNGNVHCYGNCAVMHQGRQLSDQPICAFPLIVRTAKGLHKRVHVATVVLPCEDASLSTIVHIIREDQERPTALELDLGDQSAEEALPDNVTRIEDKLVELTEREREVLEHLARGLSTPDIADALCISPVTVRNHVQRVLEKLDVHTKMAAVAYAYRAGIVH